MAKELCYPTLRRESFVLRDAMFRTKARPTHGGVDFTPVRQGANIQVFAVESGNVVIADAVAEKGDMSGKDVMILTKSGRRWWYGHLSQVNVKQGQTVNKGQVIGLMGTTGNSSGVHLHLELHYPSINNEIDPWQWVWDAPDAKGATFPPAPSREKALADYPNYSDSGTIKTGLFMHLTEAQEQEIYQTIRAIRASQVHPGGYTYDAAILNLVQGLYPALSKATAEIQSAGSDVDVDVKALAKLITDELGDEMARTLGEAIVRGTEK